MSVQSNCFLRSIFTLLVIGSFCRQSFSQDRGDIRIMFYNVENFFDVRKDSLSHDEEFLPGGKKKWNNYKFKAKTLQLFKVIAACGEMSPPEIIGFAEIENRFVLGQLVYSTPLEKYPYEIIHYDSPDVRGIDVGLILRKDKVAKLSAQKIPIDFPKHPTKRTRDILYCKVLVHEQDTVHIFVNHWPSRYGGKSKSEIYRKHVAHILQLKTDSIFQTNVQANIVIMGDFNDEPHDISLTNSLGALSKSDTIYCKALFNLASYKLGAGNVGTYRYQAHWNMLDQFIVSGALLSERNSLITCKTCMKIADYTFLLEDDTRFGGYKPRRTYLGPVYKGGFSDHLPILLDLYFKEGE